MSRNGHVKGKSIVDSVQNDPRPEDFRQFLSLIARAHLGPHQRAKVDPSDVVQQTLLEGHEKIEQFRGTTAGEMAAWLKRMLSCNITDAIRAIKTKKRDAGLEKPIDNQLDDTCSHIEDWLAAVQTSPSLKVCKNEQLLLLARALNQLQDDQRVAVELHHLHGMTLEETARTMNRTTPSVMGLIRRGLKRLRELVSGS